MSRVFLIIFSCFILIGCHSRKYLSWQQAMQYDLKTYSIYSKAELLPYFQKADMDYPPKQLALLIFKKSHHLELWARNSKKNRWHFIRSYPVVAASGKLGPKLQAGDKQVPEGIYKISLLNPKSHFDLSMELNYPNPFDQQCALHDHRKNLGNHIFIHGERQSIGCIAIGDSAINQIFPLVYLVGRGNVQVIIAPNDLRSRSPIYAFKKHPAWLPHLYQEIHQALLPFHKLQSVKWVRSG